jgi:hypothetical protein
VLAELGVLEAVGMLLPVLLPEQHLGDVLLLELEVDQGEVGLWSLANRPVLVGEEESSERLVVQVARQRPGELGDLRPADVAEHGARRQVAAPSDGSGWQLRLEVKSEYFP